jgi:hypothetical protein
MTIIPIYDRNRSFVGNIFVEKVIKRDSTIKNIAFYRGEIALALVIDKTQEYIDRIDKGIKDANTNTK